MPQGTYADEAADATISDRFTDSIGKIIKSIAPRSVTDAAKRSVPDEDDSAPDVVGRMRAAQSTDRDNSYTQ